MGSKQLAPVGIIMLCYVEITIDMATLNVKCNFGVVCKFLACCSGIGVDIIFQEQHSCLFVTRHLNDIQSFLD